MTGRIGKIAADPEVTRARHGDSNVIMLTVHFSDGGVASVQWMPGAGDDTSPQEGDIVAAERYGGILVATASKSPGDPKLKPGERELYSRDSDGNKIARLLMETDGTITLESIEGKTKLVLRPNGKYYLGNGGEDLLAALVKTIDDIANIKTVGPPPKHDVSPDDKAKLKQDQETLKSFMDSEG
ncbi:MAG: hypothetical protein LBK83_01355 [Treponema sp.]|jgi:hypothetical protein|nr:hypothetical protein [Treponema sp.]